MAGLLKKLATWTKACFIFTCSHCSCIIFILTSYSLYTQVVLILILIDVQYSQNVVFNFEKDLNDQNHSSSGFQHQINKSPGKISHPPSPLRGGGQDFPHPLTLFGAPCFESNATAWDLYGLLSDELDLQQTPWTNKHH